jgi:hypothetical protein
MRRGSSSILTNAFLNLPHVSASRCHHQGVVVSSEATQAVCIVGVYGLRSVQNGQLSDVTKRVHASYIPLDSKTSESVNGQHSSVLTENY